MGGKSKQTSETKIDPAVMARATGNFDRAQAIADQPYTPYTGTLDLSQSVQAAQGLLGFQAPTVTGRGYDAFTADKTQIAPTMTAQGAQIDRAGIANVDTGLLSDLDLTPYRNEYVGQVVDAAINDNERARQIALIMDGDRANAASAFGNARHGLLEAETNRAYDDNSFRNVGALRKSAEDSVISAALQDLGRRQQAQVANQGVDLSVSSQNASMAQQRDLFNTEAANARNLTQAQMDQAVSLANAGYVNQARQFLASAQNQADIANQGAAISSAGVRSGAAGLLGNLEQVRYGADRENYLHQYQDPIVKQGLLTSALSGIPVPQSTTTTTKQGFGLGNLIQAGAQVGAAYLGASDRRIKTDVAFLREDAKGRRWYSFRYLWDDPDVRHEGVMAQEVIETDPHAVLRHPMGFLMVDYGALH